MRIQIAELAGRPGTVVVKVEGVVDSTTLEDFFRTVSGAFAGEAKNLLFDVSSLSFISSGGLSVISDAYKKAQSRGGAVFIVGASDQIKELFGIVGFDRIFPFYRDLNAALEAL